MVNPVRIISSITLALFLLGIPAGSSFGQPSATTSCAAGKQEEGAGYNLTVAGADAEFEVVGHYDYGPAHNVHALGDILFYLEGHSGGGWDPLSLDCGRTPSAPTGRDRRIGDTRSVNERLGTRGQNAIHLPESLLVLDDHAV